MSGEIAESEPRRADRLCLAQPEFALFLGLLRNVERQFALQVALQAFGPHYVPYLSQPAHRAVP